MKKRRFLCLAVTIATLMVTPLAAYADTASAATADAKTALAPINVSLADANEMMLKGVQGQLLELGKMGDKIVITSASEGLREIREAQQSINQMNQAALQLSQMGEPASAAAITALADEYRSQISGATKTDTERLKKYAQSILEPNDKARHNALSLKSTEMYYTLKSAEEGLATVRESYDLAQTIYNQTQKKYSLGTVSKVDLLKAELDLAEAKDKLTSTENSVKQARMGFNMLFGYELMQPVNLTDSIAVPTLPSITLDDAIAKALENRNEIREAEYALDAAERAFSSYTAYPSTSAKYLQAKAKYLGSKSSCEMVPATVEQDIRTQYDSMHQLYDALQTSAKSVANAKETLRLTQLQYNSGLVTYNVVQQVRMLYESSLLSEESARLSYALAVEKFNMSIDVGTNTAGI